MSRFLARNEGLSGANHVPRGGAKTAWTDIPRFDLVGLGLIALLLLSPLIFKVRIAEGLVIHPFALLLMAAWVWVGWGSRSTFSSITSGWYIAEWQAWNVPVALLVISVSGLAFSLGMNSFRFSSFQGTGWLLLAKWMLYLAPLPLTALLTLRRHAQVITLVGYMVPLVAFGTLLYSYFRLWQAMGGRYTNAYVDASTTFFAMGTFAEVLSPDGLTVRSDTMSHTAYGMYLAFVQMFSLCLALFGGWDGLVNRRYADLQAWVLNPLAMGGILLSGSRSSLDFNGLVAVHPSGTSSVESRTPVFQTTAPGICSSASAGADRGPSSQQYSRTVLPTLDRLQETLASPLEIERTANGEVSPLLQADDRAKQSVKNLQTRVWIWGRTVTLLVHHPGTMVLGIGYDRRRFVEAVIGLPYAGPHRNYQTAHNVFWTSLSKAASCP